VYFNAWKYSGDSFRRQFLIEVASQIYGKNSERVARLEQLSYIDVLKPSHQDNLLRSLIQGFKDAFNVKFAFRGSAVARFLIGCASLVLSIAIAGLVAKFSFLLAVSILTIVTPAVFIWFSRLKFDEIFIFQEAPTYDPKMIFPERFEREFTSLVCSEALRGQRAVIAIDDLDRCEPKMVQDILISMKNFTGHENCFFVVPCDDRTIVKIFTEPAQEKGYAEEQLRKYFNVGLRIPPITSTDLVDFANTMARKTKLPLGVVQVAALANCRDARKMKHFLNSFILKYEMAKTREAAGLMPMIVDSSLLELAKEVLIEDAYPELFPKLVESPYICQLLERAALGEDDTSSRLESVGLKDWDTLFPGLGEILRRTRYIPMVHADVFFSLKSSNQEAKVPRGTELKAAVLEGNDRLIDEISEGITDAVAKTAAADLLLDLVSRSEDTFLERSITGSLRMGLVNKVFAPEDEVRVARGVTEALIYSGIPVLNQPPDHLLKWAKIAGKAQVTAVLRRYSNELKGSNLTSPRQNINNLVSSLYQFSEDRKEFAVILNDNFARWVSTREGLVALEGLDIPLNLPADERIPSERVAKGILDAVVPEVAEIANNVIRRTILFKCWDDKYAPPFLRTLTTLAEAQRSGNDYSAELGFIFGSVLLKHELVESITADELWLFVQPIYSQVTDATGKIEIAKTAIIFATLSSTPAVRVAAKNFVLVFWGTLSDPALRESVDFLEEVGSPEKAQLLASCVQQQFTFIVREKEAPTDRTTERIAFCLKYSGFLAPGAIADLFIESLEVSSGESLTKWIRMIESLEHELDSEFQARFSNKCMELVQSNRYDQNRQEIMLRTVAERFGKLPEERKREFTQQFFELLKSQSASTRNAAAATLGAAKASISEIKEFEIQVARVLGDLRRDLKTQDLIPYRPVIDALIEQGYAFGESEWQDVAEMGIRLLSQPDPPMQEFGMALSERVSEIPKDAGAELVYVLVSLEKASSPLRDRATQRLDQIANGNPPDEMKEALEKRRTQEE
jgi:hypothetical protein